MMFVIYLDTIEQAISSDSTYIVRDLITVDIATVTNDGLLHMKSNCGYLLLSSSLTSQMPRVRLQMVEGIVFNNDVDIMHVHLGIRNHTCRIPRSCCALCTFRSEPYFGGKLLQPRHATVVLRLRVVAVAPNQVLCVCHS